MNLRRARGWVQAVLLGVLVYGVLVVGAERQTSQYQNLHSLIARQQAVTFCIFQLPPATRSDAAVRRCFSNPAQTVSDTGGP